MTSHRRWLRGTLVVLVASLGVREIDGAPNAPETGSESAVAVVGGVRVERAELDQAVDKARQLYRTRTGAELDPGLDALLRRQALENIIRSRLLALDGSRRGLKVTDAEIEAQMRRERVFQTNGAFDEAKLLAVKTTNPSAYALARNSVREGLAARKAREDMERETRPDDEAITAGLEREFAHTTIDFISLRKADFDGTVPEPRERDILAAYAANAAHYARPEEATLSAIMVNHPALEDSVAASEAATREWERRMRVRADSALQAIRGGAPFATIAAIHRGMKSHISMRADRLPDFWRGGSRELGLVFATAPGSMVSEPVHARLGWVLVRVDSLVPAHVASLREVSNDIRAELRAAARAKLYDAALRKVYEASRDSLRTVAYRLRYAVADTASFAPGEPSTEELSRYYRAHLADYTVYDKTTSSVVEQPFASVREDVLIRWKQERRSQGAREAAERLSDAWSSGRRLPELERRMTLMGEAGPVPAGGEIDSGRAGPELDALIQKRGGRVGVETTPTARGYLVCHLLEVIPGYTPTLEQSRSLLDERVRAARAAEDEQAAKAAYLKNPGPYRQPARIEFSRMFVELQSPESVDLTRDEVERYYRAHFGSFSVEEAVHVRHILISPVGSGAAAEAVARAKAEDIMRRVRAGEDFKKLAAQYSDDPATSQDGGDLGMFKHGTMLEAVERAAFAMRPGDFTGPVHSAVGYHVLECLEYLPPKINPLAQIYTNVGRQCARDKSVRIAAVRADSLLRRLHSVAEARAAAKKLHLEITPSEQVVGQYSGYPSTLLPYIRKIEALKPRQLYPGTQYYTGRGYVISWVDTILAPTTPSWEAIRDRAGEIYRRDAGERSIIRKTAELDSMLARGWSFDSLATLWGGMQHVTERPSNKEAAGLGGRALLDSLVFGGEHPPALAPGQASGWIAFPGGYTKLRAGVRQRPDSEELRQRLALRRQVIQWRKANEYFDRLKTRYAVEILDDELRATVIPEPTEPER